MAATGREQGRREWQEWVSGYHRQKPGGHGRHGAVLGFLLTRLLANLHVRSWGSGEDAHRGPRSLGRPATMGGTDPAVAPALPLTPRLGEAGDQHPAKPGAWVLPSRTPGLGERSDVEQGHHRGCGAPAGPPWVLCVHVAVRPRGDPL